MHKVNLEATYRIVTPMFCAGADQSKPEFRLPSFKGVLRFWWRALAWGWYGDIADAKKRLEVIQKAEEGLFGGPRTGQSLLTLRLCRRELRPFRGQLQPALAYLAGQGLSDYKGNLQRGALQGEVTVELQLRTDLRRATQKEQNASHLPAVVDQVVSTLKILGLLGGLGSRSRRGFGSLTLTDLRLNGDSVWEVPQTVDDYAKELSALVGHLFRVGSPIPYSAFSNESRCLVVSSNSSDPLRALELLGKEMVRFRSNGRQTGQGRVNILGENVNLNQARFKNDHDLMEAFLYQGFDPKQPPERIAFGLPHNYFFSREPRKKAEVRPSRATRRASPLFLHVHQRDPKDEALAVILWLPGRFLLENEQIVIADTTNQRAVREVRVNVPQSQDLFRPIQDFLNEFKKKHNTLKVF